MHIRLAKQGAHPSGLASTTTPTSIVPLLKQGSLIARAPPATGTITWHLLTSRLRPPSTTITTRTSSARKACSTLTKNYTTKAQQTLWSALTAPIRVSSAPTSSQQWSRWETSALSRGPKERSGRTAGRLIKGKACVFLFNGYKRYGFLLGYAIWEHGTGEVCLCYCQSFLPCFHFRSILACLLDPSVMVHDVRIIN